LFLFLALPLWSGSTVAVDEVVILSRFSYP
jgi:hypothetical protein